MHQLGHIVTLMTTDNASSEIQEAIAKTMRAEVARQGVSQRHIAAEIGVGTTVLNRYMQGGREFPSTTLFAVLDVLNYDKTEFWDAVTAERARSSNSASA